MRPRYERVLLKVSGEALLGRQTHGIDGAFLGQLGREVGQAAALGVKAGLVVGGGNFLRGAAFAGRGGDRIAGDHMGMLATVMNAIAIEQSLLGQGVPARVFSALPVPTVCETFTQRRAFESFEAGEVTIFAGGAGHPFITTDTGAALRAAEMRCDALFKGTNVDGVYSADPKQDVSAVRFDRITHAEVLAKGLRVMDAAAIALARDARIPIVVFSILQSGAFVDILSGRGRATVVSD